MTPDELYRDILNPSLDLLAKIGGPKRDLRADVLLIAIAGQESNWESRVQHGNGPAHGLWQFERLGGVAGVLGDARTCLQARALCKRRGVMPEPRAVWNRLTEDDVLAAGFARLLLFTDPRSLPPIGEQDGAWRVYLKCWRPGKPRPDHWPRNYRAAMAAVALSIDH